MSNTFQVIVNYPNGEKKEEVYPFDDKSSMEEGIGRLALIHLNLRDDLRRTFEVVRIAKEVTNDPTTDTVIGADDAGE